VCDCVKASRAALEKCLGHINTDVVVEELKPRFLCNKVPGNGEFASSRWAVEDEENHRGVQGSGCGVQSF
jgi:hypothetical protein